MALPRGRQIWVWFDILSIPQRSRDLQIKAISSLPSYTQLCTRCVAHTQRMTWLVAFGGRSDRPTARCSMPHNACLAPALSLGSSRSCATLKHGARSTASPRLIARCRRARCRCTASEAGAGTSLAMFLLSTFHGRSYLQCRRKTMRSAGLRCSQRSRPSSSGAAIGVLAHAISASDFM